MKIGEVADRLGTTPRTLRFYEEQGLIVTGRSRAGTRRYDEEDVARFAAILALARAGLPLEALKEVASARPGSRTGDEASRRVGALLAGFEEELAAKRRALEAAERDLAAARELVQRCYGCETAPTRRACAACPVTADLGRAQVLHLIWDQEEKG